MGGKMLIAVINSGRVQISTLFWCKLGKKCGELRFWPDLMFKTTL